MHFRGGKMPIFEKSGRRIYFAHITKSGGTSIYSAFAESGWTVKNLSKSRDPRTAFANLKKRYGITEIEREGRMFRYPHPPQHVPKLIWWTWGPFETSFAIVREPKSRLLSAIRYHHRMRHPNEDFQNYAGSLLESILSRPYRVFTFLDGHLIPQYHFVARKTEVFRFEEDWGQAISSRFGVPVPPVDNMAPVNDQSLPPGWETLSERLYKFDFRRFSY